MLEGVECLIIAEFLQKWAYQQDVDKNDFVSFNLEKIYDNAILRFSNIHPSDWNKHTSKLEYKKISTFGKTIFLPFGDYKLSIQLGMYGNFSEQRTEYSRIKLGSDFYSLYYNDKTKFGFFMLYHKSRPPRNISNLLRNSIDWRNKNVPELFAKRVMSRKEWANSEIKTTLVNQQLIAGLGNIYACEGLLAAKVDPRKKVKTISSDQLQNIMIECKKVMNKSYELGGTSSYTALLSGKEGFGKKNLIAYFKQGMICKQCNGSIIQKILQSSKPTFYCPVCQK